MCFRFLFYLSGKFPAMYSTLLEGVRYYNALVLAVNYMSGIQIKADYTLIQKSTGLAMFYSRFYRSLRRAGAGTASAQGLCGLPCWHSDLSVGVSAARVLIQGLGLLEFLDIVTVM